MRHDDGRRAAGGGALVGAEHPPGQLGRGLASGAAVVLLEPEPAQVLAVPLGEVGEGGAVPVAEGLLVPGDPAR